MDTIYALASARGKAGVAVIRVSGPKAHDVVQALAGDLPLPRRAALRRLRWNGLDLDDALVLAFAEGSSFTGEAAAELHTHGGAATVQAVLEAVGQQPGVRLAEPGEFTRRALENGKLDLAQVEGLADLIDAETEAQRQQAMRVLSGAIGARAEKWRLGLLRAAALIEATIDFADEDVPVDVMPEVRLIVAQLATDLRSELAMSGAAERLRDGFEVAIVGAPNAGKSTLLNMLAGREAALTSAIAGTTRDVIEVRMDLQGLPVTLLDTAGLRETEDALEAAGVARAIMRAAQADLRVFLQSGTDHTAGVAAMADDIFVRGKADLGAAGDGLAVSGQTGEGVDELVAEIAARLGARLSRSGIITRARHREALTRAVGALDLVGNQLSSEQSGAELIADSLRSAIAALDSLTGRIDAEAVLGEIFSSFCIGK